MKPDALRRRDDRLVESQSESESATGLRKSALIEHHSVADVVESNECSELLQETTTTEVEAACDCRVGDCLR